MTAAAYCSVSTVNLMLSITQTILVYKYRVVFLCEVGISTTRKVHIENYQFHTNSFAPSTLEAFRSNVTNGTRP